MRAIAAADKASFAKTHTRPAIRAAAMGFTRAIARASRRRQRRGRGVFTYDDLARTTAGSRSRVDDAFTVRGVQGGPWNQGPVLLQTLNILEGEPARPATPRRLFTSTSDQARYDRSQRLLTANRRSRRCRCGLLSKQYAAERRG
jgi:gamma-glutamyltranspeptidase